MKLQILLLAGVCCQTVLAGEPAASVPSVPAGLPDPLVAADGTRIDTPEQWWKKRRPELLETFAREMYRPLAWQAGEDDLRGF